MLRWERHWWQKTEPLETVASSEPSVWVDPELVVERPRRMAAGTVPPPSIEGPYCELARERAVTLTDENPFVD